MSISYLTTNNSFDLFSNSLTTNNLNASNFSATELSVGTLTLTNKETLNVSVYYNSGFGYVALQQNLTLTYLTIDKLVFIDVPKIEINNIPNNVDSLYIAENNTPSITWGFNFKYDTYYTSYYQDASNPLVNTVYYIDNATNSTIVLSKLDNTPFTTGLLIAYPTVLTAVKN